MTVLMCVMAGYLGVLGNRDNGGQHETCWDYREIENVSEIACQLVCAWSENEPWDSICSLASVNLFKSFAHISHRE